METVTTCSICESEAIESIDPEFHFCRCAACGYLFDSPRPTVVEVSEYYSDAGTYAEWLTQEKGRDLLWQRRVRKLLLRHRCHGKLLDIGTGIGQFLHWVKPFFSEVQGTEISATAVRIAKEKYGIVVHQGVVEELDLPSGYFDVITMFHVLEHVHDPLRLLRRCASLLATDGLLVIAVPNDVGSLRIALNRISKRMGRRGYENFSPKVGVPKVGTAPEIHLSHFSPNVLRGALERCGFKVIEESIDPCYASEGLQRLKHNTYHAIFTTLQLLSGKNLSDAIWAVARKV